MLRLRKLLHPFKTGILTHVLLVWMGNLVKLKYRKSSINGDREQEAKRERMNDRLWAIATQHVAHGSHLAFGCVICGLV